MSAAVAVRDAIPSEYDEVSRITVEAYREYANGFTNAVWEEYKSDLKAVAERAQQAEIIVAENEEKLVGAVAYYPPGERELQMFPPDWASIRVLAVLPSHRGKGIGRLLTQECIERATRDGAAQIGLYTTELMMVARGMYERMGFTLVQEFESDSGFKYWAYGMALGQTPRA